VDDAVPLWTVEARGVVDRVAGARVPMVARLGDDRLAHPDGHPAPLTGQRAVHVFEARLQASLHGEDVAGGHARDV
jgi:hypothetical protein